MALKFDKICPLRRKKRTLEAMFLLLKKAQKHHLYLKLNSLKKKKINTDGVVVIYAPSERTQGPGGSAEIKYCQSFVFCSY